MTIEQLQVVISAKTDPIQKKLKEVDKSLSKLDKSTQKATKSMSASFKKTAASISKMKLVLIAVAIAAAKAGKAIFNLGADAATVDNQVLALSRTMGNNSKEFMEWAQGVAVDFGISEKAAISFGNQFSSIIARTERSGEAVSDLTQEFLKMGAVIAANTHFELDDVMGRIRSGLSGRNEAIEDLGIEVKPHIIKGTEAYAKAVRDGGVAWEKMTDAQQANVRTQAILEQGQRRYGLTLQGTAGQLIVLRAAVENMKLAWGRAFAPIIEFVIPVLQRLVGWLTVAATYTRAFLGLFFKVSDSVGNANAKAKNFADNIGGATGALGDAADGAGGIGDGLDQANRSAKKLQRTLFGFDVIHNINEPVETPAAAGGGGMEIPEVGGFEFDGDTDVGAFDEFNKKIEELQIKIKGFFEKLKEEVKRFSGWITAGIAAWGIWKLLDFMFGAAFGEGFLNFVSKLGPLGQKLLGPLATMMDGIVVFLAELFAPIVGGAAGASLAIAAFILVIAAVVGAITDLWVNNEAFRDKMIEAWTAIKETISVYWNDLIKPVLGAIKDALMLIIDKAIKPLWDSWVKLVEYIVLALADLMIALQPFVQFLAKWLGKILPPLIKVLGKVFAVVFAAIAGVVGVAFEIIGAVVAVGIDILTGIIKFLTAVFTGDWKGAWDAVIGIVDSVKKAIGRIWDAIKGYFVRVFGTIVDLIKSVWEGIKKYFTIVLGAIQKVFSKIWDAIKFVITKALDAIKWIINKVWEGIKLYISTVMSAIKIVISAVWEGIKTYFTTVFELIKTIFTTAWNLIKLIVSTVMDTMWKNIVAVWDTIKGVFNGVIDFVKNVFTGNWRGAWDAVIGIFRNLFGLIPKIFGNAWNAVLKLFSKGGEIFKGFAQSVADIFKGLVNSLIRGINLVIGAPFKALNRSFDRFRRISILGMKPFSFLPNIGIPAIPQFATGGFPEDGLFHANSNELVGGFTNGKTAVVNNSQIIAGVSEGVAAAVKAVLANQGNKGQPINLTVQIGSETIAKQTIEAIDEYTMKTGMTFKTI